MDSKTLLKQNPQLKTPANTGSHYNGHEITAAAAALPLTVSCFSIIQTGFTFLIMAHSGNPRQSTEGRKMDV